MESVFSTLPYYGGLLAVAFVTAVTLFFMVKVLKLV
jgi:hypothetical protein